MSVDEPDEPDDEPLEAHEDENEDGRRNGAGTRIAAGAADLLVHAAILVVLLVGVHMMGVRPARSDWPALGLFLLAFSFLLHGGAARLLGPHPRHGLGRALGTQPGRRAADLRSDGAPLARRVADARFRRAPHPAHRQRPLAHGLVERIGDLRGHRGADELTSARRLRQMQNPIHRLPAAVATAKAGSA